MNRDDVATRLEQLAVIAKNLGMEGECRRATEARARLRYAKAHIVVIGEFNRGKSTFVNGLIGEELLPMDIVPTTAAIWTIEKGAERHAELVYEDGRHETIPATAQSFKRLSADGDLCKPGLRFVQVTLPRLAVGDDVVIIDTPGVNDINTQRSEITYGFLANADAAIFLMDASSPVTKSEAEFLEGQVLDASLAKILFVMNKIDRVDADEIPEAMEAAEERLRALLKSEVRPIAYAASRVLSAHLLGLDDAAAVWGWPSLTTRLDELLVEARRDETRIATAARRAGVIARRVEAELRRCIDVATMKSSELATARAAFEETSRELEGRFTRLAEYGNTHGRERLKAMLARSMEIKTAEFIQQEKLRVGSLKGDFKAYGEKMLPYQVQLFVKHWFESIRPKIEQFLAEFTAVMSAESAKGFGRGLEFRGELATSESPDVAASQVDLEDFNEYVGLALPGAGLVALSFLGLGPFAVVGMAAGMMLQKGLRDRQAEAMRDAVIGALPGVVGEAGDRVVHTLSAAVDRWFDAFEKSLRDQLYAMLEARRQGFARESGDGGDERGERVADLRSRLGQVAVLVDGL